MNWVVRTGLLACVLAGSITNAYAGLFPSVVA